ncbi:hypothetical protein EN809_030295 [Mesorhizobium sp. M2E.F.Ca.ET.166.01.1.1]|nr:hypothetical protein EN862_019175 [Mesorhizobium sp. M2E.F.Ca.ET.219.01.1.1]TGT66588.1 hypothetical protein EN809_030295 [Mesorhizobium sp. M2E.F.Ca.ET.166.01.1.1]TGV98345.1 hypothetical protein EN797_030300 [Mesorhizobium sp. M2E.F.Ca.ET.154.01.1.1]
MPDISPTGGEIRCRAGFRQSPALQEVVPAAKLLISPQVGEMSGRTEGGAKELNLWSLGGYLCGAAICDN